MGSNSSVWKNIFFSVSKIVIPVTITGIMVGALIQGRWGFLAFLVGSLIVQIWFSIDVLVAHRAERVSMTNVARQMVVCYVIKVMIGAMLLLIVPLPQAMTNGWMLSGALITTLVWLVMTMKSIMAMRILYFANHD
ncbi:hypothetical protein ACN08Z_05725 [Rothia sp. P7181]|uniref:hypothetical protein n=1 Tax=Rothia sp. P7181 TaxID=3402663 RepID=UPI003AEEE4E8